MMAQMAAGPNGMDCIVRFLLLEPADWECDAENLLLLELI